MLVSSPRQQLWTQDWKQLWRGRWRSMYNYNYSYVFVSFTLSSLNSLNFIFVAFPQFRCIVDGKYQQAMGTSIECRRLDKLEEAISRSDNVRGTLSYCINVSHSFVNLREYRQEVREMRSYSYIILKSIRRIYPENLPFLFHSFNFSY